MHAPGSPHPENMLSPQHTGARRDGEALERGREERSGAGETVKPLLPMQIMSKGMPWALSSAARVSTFLMAYVL